MEWNWEATHEERIMNEFNLVSFREESMTDRPHKKWREAMA